MTDATPRQTASDPAGATGSEAADEPRRRGHKVSVPIVTPYPTKRVKKGPRWWERLRGLFGMTVLVIAAGVVLAVLIAFTLVAAAIFVATAFN